MEERQLKVNNFITLFNVRLKHTDASQDQVLSILTDLIKPKSYLPYDDKIALVMSTIDATKDAVPCLPNRNRLFIVNLIKTYTELDVSVSDFDTLSQNMFIEPILSTFENEYKICSSIMNMCLAEIGGVEYE